MSFQRKVDDSVATGNLHLAVGIDRRENLIQRFVIGEIGEITCLSERLVENDDAGAEQSFEV